MKFLEYIRKYWKFIAIGVIIILFFWQYIAGWAQTRNLYNQLLDNLREDKTKVIEVLEERVTNYEMEIANLQEEVEKVRKDREVLKAESTKANAEVARLKEVNRELEGRRENIVAPSDINKLIDDLHKFGLKSIR